MQIQQCLENEARVLIRVMTARLFFHLEQIGLYCGKTATKLQWLKISVYFLVTGSLLQDFVGSCLPCVASSFHAIFMLQYFRGKVGFHSQHCTRRQNMKNCGPALKCLHQKVIHPPHSYFTEQRRSYVFKTVGVSISCACKSKRELEIVSSTCPPNHLI